MIAFSNIVAAILILLLLTRETEAYPSVVDGLGGELTDEDAAMLMDAVAITRAALRRAPQNNGPLAPEEALFMCADARLHLLAILIQVYDVPTSCPAFHETNNHRDHRGIVGIATRLPLNDIESMRRYRSSGKTIAEYVRDDVMPPLNDGKAGEIRYTPVIKARLLQLLADPE